jgi:predicted RNase H-like HicB family nuclease
MTTVHLDDQVAAALAVQAAEHGLSLEAYLAKLDARPPAIAPHAPLSEENRTPTAARFPFEIAICPDEDGGYFVIVPELAGVVSEGDSVEEAEANVSEAIQGALIVYREHGEPIPLRREGQPELPPDCIRKWIVENV